MDSAMGRPQIERSLITWFARQVRGEDIKVTWLQVWSKDAHGASLIKDVVWTFHACIALITWSAPRHAIQIHRLASHGRHNMSICTWIFLPCRTTLLCVYATRGVNGSASSLGSDIGMSCMMTSLAW